MNAAEDQLDLFSFLEQPQETVAPKTESPSESASEKIEISSDSVPIPPPVKEKKILRRQDYQQLALGFLCSRGVEAVAMQVPARFRKYQVTAAGFRRGDGGHYKTVKTTVVVVLYEKFDRCFADCADRDLHLEALHSLRIEKERLEAEIRLQEPELGSLDDLFAECRTWDYSSSKNTEYLKLRRKFEKLQHALHQGSRLEHIRATGVADYCYLAVPAGLVAPDEVAAGWGLVYLGPERSFELVREAEQQSSVTPEGRQILAQNIAVAAQNAVRFSGGVDCSGSGRIIYRRIPRKKGLLR